MTFLGIVRTGVVMGLFTGLLAGCGGSGYGGGGGSNPPANLDISVAPTAINVGQSATVTWTSNGNTCTASGDWSGTKAGSGNETVTPAAAGTFTYSLRCRGGGYGESNMGSATLTVSAAVASVFRGEACCVDAKPVDVAGIVTDAGAFRVLALGTHVVGAAGKSPAVFESCGACLAGKRLADASAVQRLDVTGGGASLRGALRVRDAARRPEQIEFSAARGMARGADLAALAGTYSASLSSGYTFTLTVEANGDVSGADTQGCLVRGHAIPSRPVAGTFRLSLDVSACGSADGRYRGNAAPLAGDAGRPAGLFLSASNRDSAIGWQLAR